MSRSCLRLRRLRPDVSSLSTGRGPRPIVQEEVGRYAAAFGLYTRVRPGLTGLWQVSGRTGTTYAQRVALDSFYVRKWSVWLDLYIFLRTFRAVLTGDGAR